MKQMSLIEMDGFLKGKCIPRDLKVNETNVEYLVRKFGELESKLETALRECRSAGITIDNLEAKCTALAAESAGLKKFCEDAAFDADYESELLGERGGFVDGLSLVKTPATDAFLAEVRAQGVEMFSEKFGGGTPLSNMVKEVAADFAAKLRKGGNQ
ncbi:TPA: hypothetical protein P7P97_003753 [Escherichia coli]|nr:hypothetical protein [Escherichia coli]HDQ1403603.1 hypothetical protein [Escherichia coli]